MRGRSGFVGAAAECASAPSPTAAHGESLGLSVARGLDLFEQCLAHRVLSISGWGWGGKSTVRQDSSCQTRPQASRVGRSESTCSGLDSGRLRSGCQTALAGCGPPNRSMNGDKRQALPQALPMSECRTAHAHSRKWLHGGEPTPYRRRHTASASTRGFPRNCHSATPVPH